MLINLPVFKARYCLGLYISSHQVEGVLLDQGAESKESVHRSAVSSEQNILAVQNLVLLEQLLSEILNQFSVRTKGQYIPLQVSLADPFVKAAVFDVESVPAQQKARDDLIKWRFEKEHHMDMQFMSVATDVISTSRGKQIYAMATRTDVVDLVSKVSEQCGFILTTVDAAAHYFFNNVNALLEKNASLLQLHNDYWTLLVWNKDKGIQYMRSKLFRSDEAGRAHELEEILLDVERLLHSFVESRDAGAVNNVLSMLYIEPAAYDRGLLQTMLEKRIENKFMFLDQLGDVLPACKKDSAYDMAAITAVCR